MSAFVSSGAAFVVAFEFFAAAVVAAAYWTDNKEKEAAGE
jgi:cbb3-type cytochrome oxidase subunit 3